MAWQLENLQTDYIDVGFIHCLDEESDLAAYQANGVLDYVLDLKSRASSATSACPPIPRRW